MTRRKFLKASGITLGGLVVYSLLPLSLWLRKTSTGVAEEVVAVDNQRQSHHWAMLIDITKCIGCRRCLNACKLENGVPQDPELNRTWLERYEMTDNGDLRAEFISRTELVPEPATGEKGFYVPKLCNQCANPPCVSVCPVNATFKTPDGVILVDKERCIGCKYCIVACPYGARYLHPETKVVDKCTFCYHRITRGIPPACVAVCPTGARAFGDINNPDDPVRLRLEEEALRVIKPSLGTKPTVYYNGLREGVR
ncbi:MAG: 4Fe-4S dicluster domain-containing protein [Chloroflexi bacterium]|nr:4Fe-4S dicluster domain-containing protein [Chloroflexota bacterium]